MTKIKKIQGREIYNSRGKPTIETKVTLEDGSIGIASVPEGASAGIHEAHELKDSDKFGVRKALSNVNNQIKKALVGKDVRDQDGNDKLLVHLDNSENKSNFGANAILSVSIACLKAAAFSLDIPLYLYIADSFNFKLEKSLFPLPFFNILNGGKHAENNIDVQEFMIVPYEATSVKEAIKMGAKIYQSLKEVLKQKGLDVGVGDEGGFAPNLDSTSSGLNCIIEAIKKSEYKEGKDIKIALDVAASSLYKKEDGGCYFLKSQGVCLKPAQLISLYNQWISEYPIMSIEDGLEEDDFDNWKQMVERLGSEILIVGDDLLVTNPKRIKKSIEEKLANAAIIKPNQIGTVTETIEAIKLVKQVKWKIIVSHRSGETNDDFIADLAYAVGAYGIKAGAPCRGERLAKYNRLLEIEREIRE